MKNWAENLEFNAHYFEPANFNELLTLIYRASDDGSRRIRVVGSLWSFTDMLYSNDVIINISRLDRIIGLYSGNRNWGTPYNLLKASIRSSNRKFAYVEAGITIEKLFNALDQPGINNSLGDADRGRWALFTMGSSAGQTISGIISTSSHGGDFNLPPIADYVKAIQFIDANGNIFWVEPQKDFITDLNMIADNLNVLRENIIRNDEWFNSILVSVGSIGVIIGLVIEVTQQYGLSQKKVWSTWQVVKNLISEQSSSLANEGLFSSNPPLDFNFPTSVGNSPVNPVFDSFEIILNPYRISDNYFQPDLFSTHTDRHCLIIGKARASNYGFEEPVPGLSGGASFFSCLGELAQNAFLVLRIESGGPGTVKDELQNLFNRENVRRNIDKYYPNHLVRNTGGSQVPGLGMEIAVPTQQNKHIEFINRLLSFFDMKVGLGKKFIGFFSIRFTRPSKALLAINYNPIYPTRICHIEILALKEVNAVGGVDHSGNFEGDTDEFVRGFELLAHQYNYKLHWGQLHSLNRGFVSSTYGKNLQIWKKIRTQLDHARGVPLFSNFFTLRTGLESNSEYIVATQGRKSSEKIIFGYDGQGQIYKISSATSWGKTYVNISSDNIRFTSPILLTSTRHFKRGKLGEIIYFYKYFLWGLEADDQLCRVSNEGDIWIKERFPNTFSSLANSTLSIAAVTRGDRHDLFNLDNLGNLRHKWFNGNETGANLIRKPSNFIATIKGEISAINIGADRIDVFGLSDGALIQITGDGNQWTWINHANPFLGIDDFFSGPITVLSYGATDIDIIGVSYYGNLLGYRWRANSGWSVNADLMENNFPHTAYGIGRIGMSHNFGIKNSPTPYKYLFEQYPYREKFVGPLCGFKTSVNRMDLFGFGDSGNILHISRNGHWLNIGNRR